MRTKRQERGGAQSRQGDGSASALRRVAPATVVLLAALGCAQGDGRARTPGPEGTAGVATAAGTVELEVRFVGAECAETPAAAVPPCSGPYPAYEVSVLSARGESVAARVTTDAQGRGTLRLPVGDYVIRVPAGMPPAAPAETRFRVEAGATVRVPLAVDTGVR